MKNIFPAAMAFFVFAALAVAPASLFAQRGNSYGRQAPPAHAPAYGYHAGNQNQVIKRLPRGAEEHRFRGQRLYSDRGIFYREARRGKGFVIVPAPVGLRVGRLPRGAQQIGRGRDAYYFAQGNYFARVARSNTYEVIPAPRRQGGYGYSNRGYSDRGRDDRRYDDRRDDDRRDDDRYEGRSQDTYPRRSRK